MYFGITWLSFAGRRPGAGPVGPVLFDQDAPEVAERQDPQPGGVAVAAGQQLRRWGALVAIAGLALPGVTGARGESRTPEVAVVEAGTHVASGVGAGGDLPSGDAWVTLPRAAAAAPWEAGVVEADGKPLPTAPPPGPVPVDGVPLTAAPAATAAPTAPPGAPKGKAAPGEIARSAPSQSMAAPAGDLVPADREYLRPILIRYAQENGLPADLVMSLAWVESSWRRNAGSDAGAVGVMQLMPNTVEYVSKKLLGLRTNLDPRNPTSNVRMGTKYLRHLLNQNRGNVRQALIAYNQGLTSLRTNGAFGVAERYADQVLALRPRFRSS